MSGIDGYYCKWSLLYSLPFVGECAGKSKPAALVDEMVEKVCRNKPKSEIEQSKQKLLNHVKAQITGNVVKLVAIIALAVFLTPFFLLLGVKFGYQLYTSVQEYRVGCPKKFESADKIQKVVDQVRAIAQNVKTDDEIAEEALSIYRQGRHDADMAERRAELNERINNIGASNEQRCGSFFANYNI